MSKFDIQQAMKAQAALRSAAGLSTELFDEEQVVGMLSDEIRTLREAGSTDTDIATILKTSADIEIDADTIGKYYVDTSEWTR